MTPTRIRSVGLGGEHSGSLGLIRAHAEHYSGLSILHLDAHSDMRKSFEGSRYNHACIMARAKEVAGPIVQVGIRSMDSSELANMDKRRALAIGVTLLVGMLILMFNVKTTIAAGTFYVTPDGNDSNSCADPGMPYKLLSRPRYLKLPRVTRSR